MLRLDPSCATFTSSHILYIRLCADARALRAALPILDKPILSFPAQPAKAVEEQPLCADHLTSSGYITENSGLSLAITRDDVQEYYILGANIYIALQQWRNALTFLEHVLVTPTQNVATGPMVEAYRKWMLVALLIEGKVINILPVPLFSSVPDGLFPLWSCLLTRSRFLTFQRASATR